MIKLKELPQRIFLLLAFLVVCLAAFLRLYQLDKLPPSLYWEEVALGYDAFSISQTGMDHHGNPFPIIAFTSFGDYKPSLYFYLVVPFIKLFGLDELAVRLPSAFAGIFTVVGMGCLVGFLAKKLWPNAEKWQSQLSQLIGMIVAAISMWLIQFSRGGWEVNVATTFLLWSVVLGLSATDKKRQLAKMLGCIFLATASMYTYHATRVVAPALLLGLFALWSLPLSKITQHLRRLIIPIIFLAILVTPLVLRSGDSPTQQRFAETSITGDGQYVLQSNQLRELAENTFLAKLFTHRYLILGQQVTMAFASHFSPDFLFVSGDKNSRHSTGYTGILGLPDAVWLLIGVVVVSTAAWRKKEARPFILFLGWWLVVGILPASITKAYPHALRILPTAPVFLSLACLGFLQTVFWLKTKLRPTFFILTTIFIVGAVGGYWLNVWRFYTSVYPVQAQADWQYGYKQMVAALQRAQLVHPDLPVFVTREYGRPAMYYWFYSQTPPSEVQAEEGKASMDQGEFLSFQNIRFINSVNEAQPGIVVSSAKGYDQLLNDFSSVEKIDEVLDLEGRPVWILSLVAQPPQLLAN